MNSRASMLICCESSGVVRRAFRAAGVDAWSCDLLPADDSSPFHIQGDAIAAMRSREWTAFGFHPPCTYLNSAGLHWNGRGRGWERTEEALAFVRALMAEAGPRPYYLENPVGCISSRICRPSQSIQPYDFGEDASKRTCLWLQGLPLLRPTLRVAGRIVTRPDGRTVERWANQTDSGQNRLAPSPDRWRLRSRTYPGIAAAMATQWAPVILSATQPTLTSEPSASAAPEASPSPSSSPERSSP